MTPAPSDEPVFATQTKARCISEATSDIPRRTFFDAGVTEPDESLIPTHKTFISSEDFRKTATKRDPTYRITQPGTYVLQEDIELDFGEPDTMEVPFHFGFVIGISISGDNVRLDLNGKTIRMSDRFLKHARFFNIIELAQVPYPKGKAGFTLDIIPARNVIIENGTIGQTSHGSIHGNDNERVLIRDLTIKNFEVAAIAINNGRNMVIDRVVIDNSGVQVPAHSTFGVMWTLNRTLARISANNIFPEDVRAQANNYMADADLLDILQSPGSDAHRMTELKSGKPEGSMYGIYVNSKFNIGQLEGGVVSTYSQNIVIQNVHIRNIATGPYEVVGMSVNKRRVFDSFGNNLRWDFLYDNTGVRLPLTTPLNRLKYKLMRMLLWSTRVRAPPLLTQQFVDMILDETNLITAQEASIFPVGGLDIRDGHSPKGIFGIRLDGVENVRIDNCTIDNVTNSDARGASPKNNIGVHAQFPVVWNGKSGSKKVYKGNYAFGISFASSANVDVVRSAVANVRSENGNSMGMAFIGPTRAISVSQMKITNTTVNSQTYEDTPAALPNLNTKAMVLYKDEETSDIQFRDVTTQVIHSSPKSTCTGGATDSKLCPASEGWNTIETRCEGPILKGSSGPRVAESNIETSNVVLISLAIIASSLAICVVSALTFLYFRWKLLGHSSADEGASAPAGESENDHTRPTTFRGGRPFVPYHVSRGSLKLRKNVAKNKSEQEGDEGKIGTSLMQDTSPVRAHEAPLRTSSNTETGQP
eukprot:GEMP01007123.1.p1 GENE.GEMP01007123.1~~GEMP01007123.1.p1  ORF type:complete len:811 (+),score=175.20 GEMP01007123.1:157-2433(+)